MPRPAFKDTTKEKALPMDNGWNRWRGEVDTRLSYLCEGQKEQKGSLDRVEEGLNRLLVQSEERQDAKVHQQLDGRVSKLENSTSNLRFKVALFSGLAGGIITIVTNYFINYLVKS